MPKPKLHIISGPTAVGKTAVAIQLAKQLSTSVISADSMQVYIGMDIGTAKPTKAEMDEVKHHQIDVVHPNEPYSVADYVSQAEQIIKHDIHYNPVIAGGTGFYINAIIYGTNFTETEEGQHDKDNQLRQYYTQLAQEKGPVYLHEKLQAIDPDYAATLHPNNVKKVVRALSFCETTGKLFSVHNKNQKAAEPKYDVNFTILTMPREILYDRINTRVAAMWEAGLPQEVSGLLRIYSPSLPAMQGIGYKETIPYIEGRQTKEETISQIQQATRNYAKRQETWFRHQAKNARWIDVSNKTRQQITEQVLQ